MLRLKNHRLGFSQSHWSIPGRASLPSPRPQVEAETSPHGLQVEGLPL